MKKLAEFSSFLKTLSVVKVFNAFKVLQSYYFSKYTGRNIHWGMPVSVSIEPTTACNLGCPECPSGLKKFSRPTGNLKEAFFLDMLNQLQRTTAWLTFYFQGEPYINPAFLKMVRAAADRNIYTSTSTNAHFLDDKNARDTIESGLHRLIISIDGTTQETYEQYRIHGKLDKVIEGTRNIVRWKKQLNSRTPHIVFQFLVVRPNEHQVGEVRELAKELGVDEVKFKTAQVYDYENGNDLIPTLDKYSRYREGADGKYTIRNTLDNHCWRLWNSTVITWDGSVVPCCFDKDATHQMGSLQQDSFASVWKNKSYRDFRSAVLRSRREIDICANCSEGTKVWA
jgi:radical SAM protein with 4Fe4S-binding SPASM domain